MSTPCGYTRIANRGWALRITASPNATSSARVIGASGTLTGYAGGLERKRWLLDHESGDQPMLA